MDTTSCCVDVSRQQNQTHDPAVSAGLGSRRAFWTSRRKIMMTIFWEPALLFTVSIITFDGSDSKPQFYWLTVAQALYHKKNK